ncbi:hypothetical protein [Phyllobacterium sp. YR531]|uniref:hypothetical protein n=1 Tax=Phyllobacterium sp. YR531 TaxID=1144343 RepID=UPI00026F5B9F|nr:hypothetical protein [Phyllobacterium sp. YR531]EJN02509.1 hypothetical protein PMI41_03261 [Phyllobacterium sp. YR531]
MKFQLRQPFNNLHLYASWTLLVIVVVGAVLLAGCVTQDPRLTVALKTARVTDVRIELAPDLKMGSPLLNGVSQQSQVTLVSHVLQQKLSQGLKGYPGGTVPARLVVTLHDLDVASTPGRIIAGNNSFIDGTVRLEDMRTGSLIAQAQQIRANDITVRGGGLAIIPAMVINAAVTPNQTAVATQLAETFAKKVRTWLTPR